MTKELTRYDNNYDNLERQALSLSSTTPEAMTDIIRGLYAGRPLLGEGGLLTKLVKDLTQIALQGEMDSHLQEGSLEEGGNRRNGITSKRMKTSSGSFVCQQRNKSDTVLGCGSGLKVIQQGQNLVNYIIPSPPPVLLYT